MCEALILALGNPLRGDDGVGPAVVEALRQAGRLPKDVTLLDDGGRGLMTVLLNGGYRRVTIVDAADLGVVPGEWVCFSPNDVALDLRAGASPRLLLAGASPAGTVKSRGTLHNAGLDEVLAIGQALGTMLPEIVIYGIQPLEVGWSPGLSGPAQRAVLEICEAITEKERRLQWLRSSSLTTIPISSRLSA